MIVYFDNRQEKFEITEEIEELITRTIEASLNSEKGNTDYEISVSFVDNEEIASLNAEFRNKNEATDVLSFPMEDEEIEMEIELEEEVMLGDIVLSCERAHEQSVEFGHTFERELAYLTAHSMLHLMGYDHMTDEEKIEMRAKEKEIMKTLGIFKSSMQ